MRSELVIRWLVLQGDEWTNEHAFTAEHIEEIANIALGTLFVAVDCAPHCDRDGQWPWVYGNLSRNFCFLQLF